MTDTELLDWLEAQNKKAKYSGRCVFRWSGEGRGWRLHETKLEYGSASVRQAIINAIELGNTIEST